MMIARSTSFEVVLGAQAYSYSCAFGTSGKEDPLGTGPVMRSYAAESDFNGNACIWPNTNPSLEISVQFARRDSTDFPVGEFDMADSSAAERVRITMIVSPAGSLPESPQSVEYRSYVAADGGDGLTQLPNLSGTVSSRLIDSLGAWEIELNNVVIASAPEPDATARDISPVATIRYARTGYGNW